jgi:hypothetical protein
MAGELGYDPATGQLVFSPDTGQLALNCAGAGGGGGWGTPGVDENGNCIDCGPCWGPAQGDLTVEDNCVNKTITVLPYLGKSKLIYGGRPCCAWYWQLDGSRYVTYFRTCDGGAPAFAWGGHLLYDDSAGHHTPIDTPHPNWWESWSIQWMQCQVGGLLTCVEGIRVAAGDPYTFAKVTL